MHNKLTSMVCDFHFNVVDDKSISGEGKRVLMLSLPPSSVNEIRTNFANSNLGTQYYPPIGVPLIPRAVTINIVPPTQCALLGGDASAAGYNYAKCYYQLAIGNRPSFEVLWCGEAVALDPPEVRP